MDTSEHSKEWLNRYLEETVSDTPEMKRVRRARRECGRWLILRQFVLNKTNAQVAEETGISENILLLLNLGLSRPEEITSEQEARLADVLADETRPAETVAQVVAAAHGRLEELSEEVRQQITKDVRPSRKK